MSVVNENNGIKYVPVTLAGADYYVGFAPYKDKEEAFVIDAADYPDVSSRKWHYTTNRYMASSYQDPLSGKTREVLLHNFIMGKVPLSDLSPNDYVFIINDNGLDSRRANLRLLVKNPPNRNMRPRDRKQIELPLDSGLSADDIPRNIVWEKPDKRKGGRFVIEISGLPPPAPPTIQWKGTSRKNVPVKEKLEAAVEKLAEFYADYEIDPPKEDPEAAPLLESFAAIVAAASKN